MYHLHILVVVAYLCLWRILTCPNIPELLWPLSNFNDLITVLKRLCSPLPSMENSLATQTRRSVLLADMPVNNEHKVLESDIWYKGTNTPSLGIRWWTNTGYGQATGWGDCYEFPSVLWHCWSGDRKGIQSVEMCHLCPKILLSGSRRRTRTNGALEPSKQQTKWSYT